MVAIATSALLSSQDIAWLRLSKKNLNFFKLSAFFHGFIRPVTVYMPVYIDNLVLVDPFWVFVNCTIIALYPRKAMILAETAPSKKSWLFFNAGRFLAFNFAKCSLVTSLALHYILHATASKG